MVKTIDAPNGRPYSANPPAKVLSPTFLYRFVNDDSRLASMLSDPYLWFSKKGVFNDPFELSTRYKAGNTEKRVAALLRISGMNRYVAEVYAENIVANCEVERRWLEGFRSPYIERMGICCFSQEPNVPLLWSHYASGHRGLCIAYERKLLPRLVCLQVNYVKEIEEHDLLADLLDFPNSNVRSVARDTHMFATKHDCWAYEKEFRLISQDCGRVAISREAINAVIIGAAMDDQRKSEIITKILEPLALPYVVADLVPRTGDVQIDVTENELEQVEFTLSDILFDDDQLHIDLK